jgi:hypothetical protein
MNTLVIPAEILNFLNTVLTVAILFVVVEGLKEVSNLLGKDLTGFATAITAALVGAVLTSLQWLVTLIPEAYAPAISGFFAFLVVLLGAYGVRRLVVKHNQALSGF